MVSQIDPSTLGKILTMCKKVGFFKLFVKILEGFNEYDDEHLLRICKISGVDDFVGAHPKGYDLEIKNVE